MSTATDIRLAISLEVGCGFGGEDAVPLLEQMQSGKYDEMSVMPLPVTLAQWRQEHRTARRRADRAAARGYRAGILRRELWENDIYAINTSADYRQGRPMSPAYMQMQEFSPLPEYPCPRHAVRVSGVWSGLHQLVAYLVMIRAGELALVSQILGHSMYLDDEIMYLLFEHALGLEVAADPEALVVYNRHDSGTDGLRFFKSRLGFEPMPVKWLP